MSKKERDRTKRRREEREQSKKGVEEDPLVARLQEVMKGAADQAARTIVARGFCGKELKRYADVGSVVCLLPEDHGGECALLYMCSNCRDTVPWPEEWPVTKDYLLRWNFCGEGCLEEWKAKMGEEFARTMPGIEVEFSGPQDRN